MPVVRLFVYGSLRRGCSNHRELSGAEYLRALASAPRYGVIEVDGYPALVRGTMRIEGELYEVTHEHLARLDAFEGSDYVRAPVTLDDGSTAFAYFRSGTVEGDAR